MQKILILTAPFGKGHTKAAEALRVILSESEKFSNTEIIVKDVFAIAYELIGKAIVRSYLKLLDSFPAAYGLMYGWGEGSKASLVGRDAAHAILARGLYKYILKMSPVCVICSHPTPAGAMDYLVRKKNLSMPVLALVTDFVGHNWWIYNRVAKYYVPSAEVKEYFAQNSIDRKKIVVCGIPIDAKFKSTVTEESFKVQKRTEAGFKADRPLILIMGGGEGILPMDKIAAACCDLKDEVQIAIVTGSNIELYRKLKRYANDTGDFLKVWGYTDKVAELMAMSDLLITKPGGVTMAEALAMQLPMIIFKPIPGQEEGNSKYLIKNNAAVYVEKYDEFAKVIRDLLFNKKRMEELKANAAQLACRNADTIIADSLSEYLIAKGHKL